MIHLRLYLLLLLISIPLLAFPQIGSRFSAGTTWYDQQHNTTAGRMVDVDALGYVHVVWMNGLDEESDERHVFYNVFDPDDESYSWNGGIQIDSSERAGYITVAVTENGRAYPAFHQTFDWAIHSAVEIDSNPRSGAFTSWEPCYRWDPVFGNLFELIWPKIALDRNGLIHIVSTEPDFYLDSFSLTFYSRGIPNVNQDSTWIEWLDWTQNDYEGCFSPIDSVVGTSIDIVASRQSDRLAIAYSRFRGNLRADTANSRDNDLLARLSEDGGHNWGEPLNITNFIWPDWDCESGDTAYCNRDTFRVYEDLSLLFDENDNLHVAFTTAHYYALQRRVSRYASQIWHWGEDFQEYSPIHAIDENYHSEHWAFDIGDYEYVLQRPSLAIDLVTGDLFCSFQFRDTLQWSAIGIPQADAWVARSVDNGRSWSEGINVTNTNGGQFAPAGECLHEIDVTLAEQVTYSDGVGYLHMTYVLDTDAGDAIGASPIGVPTLNDFYYHRIPIDAIPAWPLWNYHWPVLHVDSTGIPYEGLAADDSRPTIPTSPTLYQNYPNPFNPATTIQFDLPAAARVSLIVHNILGREVKTLLSDKFLTAGSQQIAFDASALPSGVYLYTLTTDNYRNTRKMILLK